MATGAGRLPYRFIIHVAGLHAYWVASERSIRLSTTNAANLANELGVRTLAFPIIGGGTGGAKQEDALNWMLDALSVVPHQLEARIVRFAEAAQ